MSQDKLKPFLLLLTLLLKIVSRYMYIYRIAWVYRDMYCELHVLSHPYVNAFFPVSRQIANRIRTTVQDMGNSCVKLVQNVCNNLGDPNAMHACPDLQHHVSSVRVNVSSVLVALQSGSRGTQACINAARAVRGIIADLDTTIMFATVGALCTQGDDNFASHK